MPPQITTRTKRIILFALRIPWLLAKNRASRHRLVNSESLFSTSNLMKRHCKNIDITHIDFIKRAVVDCFKHKNKDRKDVRDFLRRYKTADQAAAVIQSELKDRVLVMPDIYYRKKVDEASGKVRLIGVQNIKQQIYDTIAVNALKPVLRQIGLFQCASIKGRGQIYGVRQIQRWLKTDRIGTKYALKADIKKYYPSIDQDKLMSFLERRIKNEDLLWLIRTLLETFDEGLAIGSFLSQNLANLYLSQLYHFIEEDCYIIKTRRKVEHKEKLASHVLFYMDDILVFGSNKSDLKRCFKMMEKKLSEMGLEFKDDWSIFLVDKSFVDMMGFKIYRDRTTIRKRNWKRVRRALIRFDRKLDNIDLARRVISYHGFISNSNSVLIDKKYGAKRLKNRAAQAVSKHTKEANNAVRKSDIWRDFWR